MLCSSMFLISDTFAALGVFVQLNKTFAICFLSALYFLLFLKVVSFFCDVCIVVS